MKQEEFWIYNPSILFTKISDIFPSETTNTFNAISRYWLVTFIIFLIFSNYKWSYLCGIGFIVTTFLGYIYTKDMIREEKIKYIKKHQSCRRSTINNPMGNLLPLDPQSHLEACDDEPQEKIHDNLFWEFYEDQDNLTAKTKLRAFITMPITSIVNKRKDFLNFMYQPTLKCKTDGIGCYDYRDLRFNK